MRGHSQNEPSVRLTLPAVACRTEGQGLIKLVLRLEDQQEIESVIVPMQHAQRHWKSLCVSSQVGCRHGCHFCQTATLGLVRDLSAGEIVSQLLSAHQQLGESVRTVVFMGMGEPLDNLAAVIQAIRVMTDQSGLGLSMSRITISTVGIVDGIRQVASLGWRRLNLGISLNAPNDTVRAKLMPIAQREPMAALVDAMRTYPLRRNQHFMVEYVLVPGVNDAREHALELADRLASVRSMVNVIPHNPRPHARWKAPKEAQVLRFLGWLKEAGQPCRRRVTRGLEQWAACGQLGARRPTSATDA
jgi:23S rRNA (adenine2503-C2)-methyltransferase